jgi:hypothetical protein
MAKAHHRKIKFYYNRYLRRFGPDKDFRDINTIRNALSVSGHAGIKTAEKYSKWVFTCFWEKYLEE